MSVRCDLVYKSQAHRRPLITNYDHHKCEVCGWILTDGDPNWGIAKNNWFESLAIAKFYREHGRYPEKII